MLNEQPFSSIGSGFFITRISRTTKVQSRTNCRKGIRSFMIFAVGRNFGIVEYESVRRSFSRIVIDFEVEKGHSKLS